MLSPSLAKVEASISFFAQKSYCFYTLPLSHQKKVNCTAAASECNVEESDSDSDDNEKVNKFDFLAPRLSSMNEDRSRLIKPSWGASWNRPRHPYELGNCPHCNLVLPLITLRWHEVPTPAPGAHLQPSVQIHF